MPAIDRRAFLSTAALGAAGLGSPRVLRGASAKGPNVLFFFVDDLRVQLGCYGRTAVKSPNIDRLAAGGTLFARAYCQQAVCAPTRASVLSGLRPDGTGIYDLEHPLRTMDKNVVTLPQFFRARGYETVTIGKVYHHYNDDKENWSRQPQVKGAQYVLPETQEYLRKRTEEGRAKGLTGTALSRFARGPATECADVPDEAYADGGIAAAAIEQLRELRDKPFFLCCGFLKPHLPFCAPKRYWDLYQREQFAVSPRKKPDDMPPIALGDFGELRAYTDIPNVGPLDDEGTQRLIHGYHAAVSFTDAQVGKVLAELERLGLADNTIVVIWGDHGWKLGEYGSWCKHTNFELDTHVPLIVRGPGIAAGQRRDEIVEMLDVYPTLADLTGAQPPAHCQGASLRPLLKPGASAAPEWKNFALSQYPRGQDGPVMGYSLRWDRWRYTEWVHRDGRTLARELYDHAASDVASANVVDKPEHAALTRQLSARIRPFVKTRWDVFARPGAGKARDRA